MGRGDLTDGAWAQLAALLPPNGRRGGQWVEHRKIINGILWKLRTGAPWRDLPARYGPWQTGYDRFVHWRRDGTWDRLLAQVLTQADAVGEVGWEVSVDSSSVRAHHHAAGARHQPSGADQQADAVHPQDEALGHSRGGLTTKVHLACDSKGRLLSVVLTPGQRHDSTQLGAVLDAIRVPRPGRCGRPRRRPTRVIADKGYSYPTCRRRGIKQTIPERRDQRQHRSRRPGRPLGFDAIVYRGRNVVERCINKLKQWRSIATRYEKRGLNYRAMVSRAAFYRNYQDKYDLVEKIYADAIGNLLAAVTELGEEHPAPIWVQFFEHITQYDRLYRALLGRQGSPWFAWKMRATLIELIQERGRLPHGLDASARPAHAFSDELVPDLVSTLFVEAITWWLEQGKPYTPAEIAT